MSLGTILANASSGLAVSTDALAVISNNISNASTTDYVAETATQTSVTAGGIGIGAAVGLTQRNIDTQLETALFAQNSATEGLQTTQTALAGIDAVQGTPAAGTDLGSLLAVLQNSFTALQGDPSNQTQQSAVVDAAGTLVNQINGLANAVSAAQQNAQDDAVSAVADANAALSQIGVLNASIMNAQALHESTADMENQRDAAVDTLNKIIPVTVVPQTSGVITVVAGGSYVLPTNPPSSYSGDPTAITGPLSLANANVGTTATQGATLPGLMMDGSDITSTVTGGQLGADLTLRNATLPTYAAELDEFAHTLAAQFDSQGLTLFTDNTGTVPTSNGTTTQSGYLGFAQTIQLNPVAIATPSVVRDGLQGSTATTPSGNAGDDTLIDTILTNVFGSFSSSGSTGPSTTGLGASGTISLPYAAPTSLADFATDLVSSMSGDVSQAKTQLGTATALQTTLQTKFSNTSGVNVDTELANMVTLQAAYAANGKVIETAQSLWAALLEMVVTP